MDTNVISFGFLATVVFIKSEKKIMTQFRNLIITIKEVEWIKCSTVFDRDTGSQCNNEWWNLST